jgi:hypothetical protein
MEPFKLLVVINKKPLAYPVYGYLVGLARSGFEHVIKNLTLIIYFTSSQVSSGVRMAASSDIDTSSDVGRTVESLEEMFKDRYTENDEEFMAVINTPAPPPPCVENWYPRGNYG